MLQKSILSESKWGAQAVVKGRTAPLAPPWRWHWLPEQKMIPQWLILLTYGKKQQSHTLNQGCKFELKPQKSRLSCRTRKNSVDFQFESG